jgi:hypothetical protein
MTSIDQCLDQVRALRAAATDPRDAYLVRSRLERLILSCARAAARAEGRNPPEVPGIQPEPSSGTPRHLREIIRASSALYRASADLCRPSESLDVRWNEGWLRVERALDDLEVRLRTVPREAQVS